MPTLSEEEIQAIIDQIIVDVGNKDYTAMFSLFEDLAKLDSTSVTLLLRGFLSEGFFKYDLEEEHDETNN